MSCLLHALCSQSSGAAACRRAGAISSRGKPYNLLLKRSPGDLPEATAAAAKAASAEASANADSSNAAEYGKNSVGPAVLDTVEQPLVAKVTVASAAALPQVTFDSMLLYIPC